MLLQEEHWIMKVKTLCMLEDKRYQTLCIQFAINLSRQLITIVEVLSGHRIFQLLVLFVA
jgi:hypothetical protein